VVRKSRLSPRPDGLRDLGGGRRSTTFWLVVAICLMAALWLVLGTFERPGARLPYSQFLSLVDDGKVENVTVEGDRLLGNLREPIVQKDAFGEQQSVRHFITYVPGIGDPQLLSRLEQHGVQIDAQPETHFPWEGLLFYVLPFVVFIWLGGRLFRRMQSDGSNLFSMGRSRARTYERQDGSTTFDDVAGNRGAKAELREIVEFLRRPDRFTKLGGQIPRGVLLLGPPGTGKTLLARAVAGEAGVPFFIISGSDFMEMLVGVGASRVRDLFRDAKRSAPSIIFIDELDSIGRKRGTGLGGGHDEREQTLNQLLSEMDGFEPHHHVIVMAATNRPDVLDPALLRPGRFDRQVTVDLPTKLDREEILKIHARNKPLEPGIDFSELARATPGFSGADLANLLNEAALLAARYGHDKITPQDVEKARDKVTLGLERENLQLDEEQRRVLAYHEGGHAVVAAAMPHADPLHKVSIVPRGRAMGATEQLPEREKYVYAREHMLDRLAVMMGGRAAENLVLNTATSGAESDLKRATWLARKMVLDWGMSERLGHMAFQVRDETPFLGEELGTHREFSESTGRLIDEEVRVILREAYDRATEALMRYRAGLDRLAEALLHDEEIGAERALALIGIGTPDSHLEPGHSPYGPM
jgi:cell division protease FtsH